MTVILSIIATMFWILLGYYSILAVFGIIFRSKSPSTPILPHYPSVTVLIPCHNEEQVIADTLNAITKLDYPGDLRILVLNDNSEDRTGGIALSYQSVFRNIELIEVPPGFPKGKSRVLNYGLSLANSQYIAVYDADNQPEPKSLRKLVEAAETTNKSVGAVGYVKTINHNKNWLTRMIGIEFSVFQLLMQCGRWKLFNLGSLTGTNMIVLRSALLEAGAWDPYALAEDAELTLKLTATGGLLPIVPDARTWEQEPEMFSVWLRQRTRWMQGNIYIILKTMKTPAWFHGKVLLHTIQLLSVYIGFVFFLFVSDIWFILGAFGIIHTGVTTPLLLVWFESLLFYIIQLISAETVDGTLSLRNILYAFLMYFSYAQFWTILLIRACYKQLKLSQTQEMPTWDKTVRF